jgi:hypothetical protein
MLTGALRAARRSKKTPTRTLYTPDGRGSPVLNFCTSQRCSNTWDSAGCKILDDAKAGQTCENIGATTTVPVESTISNLSGHVFVEIVTGRAL